MIDVVIKRGFQVFATILLACIVTGLNVQDVSAQAAGLTDKTAKVMVLVRNEQGAPVPDLTADDFIVTEHGARDPISSVESLFRVAPIDHEQPARSALNEKETNAPPAATHVLLIITPMSAVGRSDALRAAIRFLSRPEAESWQIALLDGSGSYVSFGRNAQQLREILQKPAAHVSAPQYIGSSWLSRSNRAIQELGILPGRRAIVVVSDYESNMFIDSALQARAALYTVQSSGPVTAVPFGSAAGEQFAGSGVEAGPEMARELREETVRLGNLRSDFLCAADATGGMPARDLKDAFDQIAADAAGSYLVSFQAHPNEADGAWHPVSIRVRTPHLRVRGPGFYEAPVAMGTTQLPDGMKRELQLGDHSLDLMVAAHAWLFPNSRSGVHTGVFAAELEWSDKDRAPAIGSRLQIFAELVNETTNSAAGSWYEERDWPAEGGKPSAIHWQKEAPIYPDSYALKVIAMDAASGKMGATTFAFMAHPLDGQALRFSGVVLADGCVPAQEQAANRQNLLDPLLWKGCELNASPTARFKSSQNLTVFVRLYPPDERFSKIITKQWKAYALVDSAAGQAKTWPLQIASAEVRGLVTLGEVSLSELHLKPGPHQLTVVFEVPTDNWGKHRIPLNGEFSIEP
jgi:VWFA-related protein